MRRRRNGRPTSALGDMPWRNGICHARQSPSAPTSSSTRWCRRLVRLAPPISSLYDDEPFSKKGRARDARTGKKKSQTSVTQSINTKNSPYTYVCVVLNEGEKTPSTDPLRLLCTGHYALSKKERDTHRRLTRRETIQMAMRSIPRGAAGESAPRWRALPPPAHMKSNWRWAPANRGKPKRECTCRKYI